MRLVDQSSRRRLALSAAIPAINSDAPTSPSDALVSDAPVRASFGAATATVVVVVVVGAAVVVVVEVVVVEVVV